MENNRASKVGEVVQRRKKSVLYTISSLKNKTKRTLFTVFITKHKKKNFVCKIGFVKFFFEIVKKTLFWNILHALR